MENKILLPIEALEIRSSSNNTVKRHIKGRAKLIPGKKYSYLFKKDENGVPIESLKEIISDGAWEKIKKKILSKEIFIDENHKTIAEMNVNRTINDLSRETGKDLKEFKNNINKWMKVSDMQLLKLDAAELNNEFLDLDIVMNPHYAEIDSEHSAYSEAVWKSVQDKYLNSISFNFVPTKVKQIYDAIGNELVPQIEDMDIYGISLVNSPAYDDMYDVLDVAVRSAQEVIINGGKKMEENQNNENGLKAEIEKLKQENLEKDKLIKENDTKERQAEIDKLVEEKTKLQAELENRNKMLQERSMPSRGLVPPQPMNDMDFRQRLRETLKPIEEGRELGKAIALQAEYDALGSLSPETLATLKSKDHIHLLPKNHGG